MADNSNSNTNKSDDRGVGNSLTTMLVALQQGVTAINNMAQTMQTIFPSS